MAQQAAQQQRGVAASSGLATLRKLSESGLTVAEPAEDVRGRKVFDSAGHEIGTVDDLMIDDREQKVRFLRVASGGFLGIGEEKVLIPVDAMTRISAEEVHVNQARDHIAGGPRYDPSLEEPDWEQVYAYYGFTPYWAPGYVYPAF